MPDLAALQANVDLYRRAAERLRDPYRCNTDPTIDRAVADWLEAAAGRQMHDGWTDDAALAVARAVLRDRSTE